MPEMDSAGHELALAVKWLPWEIIRVVGLEVEFHLLLGLDLHIEYHGAISSATLKIGD